jgi:betaine-aldehyde dehydrogenase
VVIKPASDTPMSLAVLMDLIGDVLPPGVLNVVFGHGSEVGAPLARSPRIAKVSFTGETTTGRQIMQYAAETIIPQTMELGGKSPNIFFADADFEAAIDGALFGIFINQGEVCSAGSRVLVQRSIYQKFLEAMTEKARTIKLGPPLDRSTKMGPLVSREQSDRVSAYQQLGKSEAKLALGGGRPASMSRGYYVEPTIFYDVDNSSRIAREEIFGPVAAVIPFDDERDALRIANDTSFGLAAAVWTRDIYRALRMVKAIRAGIVWVNHMQPTYVEAPWGGFKQSGFGRELGIHGIDEYLETKQVHINLNEAPIGWY